MVTKQSKAAVIAGPELDTEVANRLRDPFETNYMGVLRSNDPLLLEKGQNIEIYRDLKRDGKVAAMLDKLAEPRKEMSPFAPRIITIKIDPDKIGKIIGPGGKVIRALQEQYGVKIDIEDDGSVFVSAPDLSLIHISEPTRPY